jgi:hypothetical protein
MGLKHLTESFACEGIKSENPLARAKTSPRHETSRQVGRILIFRL